MDAHVSDIRVQASFPSLLAAELNATYQLEALVGVGVVQNARHHVLWQDG